MAIYLKNNAVGLDRKINKFMNSLNRSLNIDGGWGIDIYHKIYKIQKDKSYLPFSFKKTKDYSQRFLNDKVIGEIGFYPSSNRPLNINTISVDVDIIFSINIKKLNEGSLQREDERVILIAEQAVSKFATIKSIKTGISEVYYDFDIEKIRHRDMQPFLNFSFTININYKRMKCYELL
jgi:hypothetical protein